MFNLIIYFKIKLHLRNINRKEQNRNRKTVNCIIIIIIIIDLVHLHRCQQRHIRIILVPILGLCVVQTNITKII